MAILAREYVNAGRRGPSEAACDDGTPADRTLDGTRPISIEQARELGALFSVKPGLFL